MAPCFLGKSDVRPTLTYPGKIFNVLEHDRKKSYRHLGIKNGLPTKSGSEVGRTRSGLCSGQCQPEMSGEC